MLTSFPFLRSLQWHLVQELVRKAVCQDGPFRELSQPFTASPLLLLSSFVHQTHTVCIQSASLSPHHTPPFALLWEGFLS